MLTKVSTYFAEGDYGYAAIPLFGPANATFEKVASSGLLPEVSKYIDALKPSKDSQYVLGSAMGAGEYYGSNVNADWFEESGLTHKPDTWAGDASIDAPVGKAWTYGFPTFYSAGAFMHHRNKDRSRAYGDVEFAAWNDFMKRVELVIRVDRDKCEAYGGMSVWEKLVAGKYPDLSMGSRVCYDLDSIDTDWDTYKKALATFDPKKWAYPGLAVLAYHKKLLAETGSGIRGLSILRKDYRPHQVRDAGKVLSDGRKVFVYNPYPRFFDISFVFIGADRTAKVMVFISGNGGSVLSTKTAEGLGYSMDGSSGLWLLESLDKTAEVLYHGSPEKIEELEPRKAEGKNSFQSQTAVYASERPLMAKLYAVGKTLKGKADFAISDDNHLIIVGDAAPESGWLHKLDEDGAVHGKAPEDKGQAYVKHDVEPVKITEVKPQEITSRIIRVKNKAELTAVLKEHSKVASEKRARVTKRGEIEKHVVPQWSVGSAIPLLTRGEKDLPKDVLRAVAKDLPKGLSTLGGLGMVLRPREFQRVMLLSIGDGASADRLDRDNAVFQASKEEPELSMGEDLFDGGLAKLLAPLFSSRTMFSPHVEDRLVMNSSYSKDEPTSVRHSGLSNIGGYYNSYRKKLVDIVTAAQDLMKMLEDESLRKVASADVSATYTPLTVAYMSGAYMDEVFR